MVNGVSKITVKNKDDEIIKTSIKEIYTTYYMQGYNFVKCFNDEWVQIEKIQKKNRERMYSFKFTDLSKLVISKYVSVMTDNGCADYKSLINENVINNSKIQIKCALNIEYNNSSNYNLVLKENKFIEVDNFYVRFDEIKTEG